MVSGGPKGFLFGLRPESSDKRASRQSSSRPAPLEMLRKTSALYKLLAQTGCAHAASDCTPGAPGNVRRCPDYALEILR